MKRVIVTLFWVKVAREVFIATVHAATAQAGTEGSRVLWNEWVEEQVRRKQWAAERFLKTMLVTHKPGMDAEKAHGHRTDR